MRFNNIILAIVFFLCFVPCANAYLDPGSGSFIIQMIIASVAGVAYAMKMYWSKIKAFIGRRPVEIDPDQELND